MAAIDWPSSLPQRLSADDYSVSPRSAVVRTQMDSGPPKVRRVFSAITKQHEASMVLTKSEYLNTFIPFFENDILDGSEVFNFNDPFDQNTKVEMRFVHSKGQPPYSVSPEGPSHVRLSFTLEQLP